MGGDIDVYIDGADESNKHLQLVKGGGGALSREKVLAAAARRFVCIVDDSKLVGMLGEFPLPIEVLPMAQQLVSRMLMKMRGHPIWREGFVTDNGNHILDVEDVPIANPVEMEARMLAESESAVLPLDDPPVKRDRLSRALSASSTA